MSLSLEVVGKTDVGRVRTNNEDNFGYDARYGIYVVCDGMGGQAAGEVASKLAVDIMLAYFREAAQTGVPVQVGNGFDGVSARASALGSAILLANSAVHETAERHASQQGMGSTVVAVSVEKDFFSIGHVGDSRIYLLRLGAILQLTNDHSLVMEQVRRGLITLEEAHRSEMANIILRALGPEAEVQPDLDDLMAMPGDILLLCSDGLTRHLSDDQMLEIVQSAATLEEACDQLIAAANAAGGEDNITCMLLRFVEQPWYKRILRRFIPGGSPKWQNSI